jgi:hypothetical protein
MQDVPSQCVSLAGAERDDCVQRYGSSSAGAITSQQPSGSDSTTTPSESNK